MDLLILLASFLTSCAACVSLWVWWRQTSRTTAAHASLLALMTEGRDQSRQTDARLAALVALHHEEQARQTAEREAVARNVGSFLPTDLDVRRLERDHRQAHDRFLSAQTPPAPSWRASGPSVGPSGPGRSTQGARSFPGA